MFVVSLSVLLVVLLVLRVFTLICLVIADCFGLFLIVWFVVVGYLVVCLCSVTVCMAVGYFWVCGM